MGDRIPLCELDTGRANSGVRIRRSCMLGVKTTS